MIEDVLYQALKNSPAADDLAKINAGAEQAPAIFWQQAPNENAPIWSGPQYPRMDYNIDWRYDEQRKTAGTLSLNVWTTEEDVDRPPEYFEPILAAYLSESFLTDADEQKTVCIVWNRSDYFEGAGTKQPKVLGVTLTYDVLEFPKQRTVTPDPVECLQRFVKAFYPGFKVIENDALTEVYRAEDTAPAFYVRKVNEIGRFQNTYAVQWVDAVIGIHVIAPSPTARQKYCEELIREISKKHYAAMDDGSTLRFIRVAFTADANPLIQGQLMVTVQYGIITPDPTGQVINEVITE